MEDMYYYLEDINGGFIVDEDYMDNEFDNETQTLVMCGTLSEICEYIKCLCNNE